MPITNYGHNKSLGHQWGANFSELIAISRYHKGRYFVGCKITHRNPEAFDFDTTENSFNHGGNIYKDYDENRASDRGRLGKEIKPTFYC
jgi:hypothetical protein